MLDFGHSVGYTHGRDMVLVLHPYIDLSRLPPPWKNLQEFLIKIHGKSSYQFSGFVIPLRASHGVPTCEAESTEG